MGQIYKSYNAPMEPSYPNLEKSNLLANSSMQFYHNCTNKQAPIQQKKIICYHHSIRKLMEWNP